MLYGGYSVRATAKLDATVSVSRQLFFQSSKPWNSTEYALDLQHQNGLGLHISHSDNYYSHNTDSLVLAGRYRHLLSNHWSTTFEAGTVELSNTNWQDHTYAQVSLMHTRDRWAFEAMAHWNSQGSDENFGLEDYSDPGVALQISYRVW